MNVFYIFAVNVTFMNPSTTAIIVAVIALAGALAGAFFNIYNTIKAENLKRNNTEQIFIHQLQFQREFEAYTALWGFIRKLDFNIILKRTIIKLEKEIDSNKKFEFDKKQYDSASKELQQFSQMVEDNKPFYAANIYPVLSEMCGLLLSESAEYLNYSENPSTNEKAYLEDHVNISSKFNELKDDLCEKIRGRILLKE